MVSFFCAGYLPVKLVGLLQLAVLEGGVPLLLLLLQQLGFLHINTVIITVIFVTSKPFFFLSVTDEQGQPSKMTAGKPFKQYLSLKQA
jgi:hypothetical protein